MCNVIAECAERLERSEEFVRARCAQISKCAGGDDKTAYAVLHACINVLEFEGEETAVSILATMGEALRNGRKYTLPG